MSVKIAPKIVDDTVYQLKEKNGSIMNIQIGSDVLYRDDLTGQILDPNLVGISKAKELEYFEARVVWEKRMMGEARRITAPDNGAIGRREQKTTSTQTSGLDWCHARFGKLARMQYSRRIRHLKP